MTKPGKSPSDGREVTAWISKQARDRRAAKIPTLRRIVQLESLYMDAAVGQLSVVRDDREREIMNALIRLRVR